MSAYPFLMWSLAGYIITKGHSLARCVGMNHFLVEQNKLCTRMSDKNEGFGTRHISVV